MPTTPGAISGPTAVCAGSAAAYSVSPVANATSYAWTIPTGAVISGSTTGNIISVIWGSSGGTITVRSINPCGLSSARSLSVAVSTCPAIAKTQDDSPPADVFPNPARDNVRIAFHNVKPERRVIHLYDLSGKEIMNRDILLTRKNEVFLLDLKKIPAGSCNLRIENESGSVQAIKFIVE
jgi:hypothetical protein